MKTKHPIRYSLAGQSAAAVLIPAGVHCVPARNLPEYREKGLYWAQNWRGMDKRAKELAGIGFLLTREEIKHGNDSGLPRSGESPSGRSAE